jgi:hypothetical protein
MATPAKPSSLFFNDGHVVDRNAIVIAGQFNLYPDADVSRIALLLDAQWAGHDVRSDTIRSVTFDAVTQRCFLMGRNGIVVSVGNGQKFSRDNLQGSWREVLIPDVARYGELFRIRAIANSVYACGQSSQIYKLQSGGWTHFDQGILDLGAETLEDIDGSAPDDIYAVGLLGTIAHYDGRAWRLLDSPTNQHLSNVRCVSRDEIYICGNNGTVFRGNQHAWTFIGEPASEVSYWGMDLFNGELYLAHSGGIVKHDGQNLVSVHVQLETKRKLTFHRLHANDGLLFSFGVDDLVYFDGQTWREVVWPDN